MFALLLWYHSGKKASLLVPLFDGMPTMQNLPWAEPDPMQFALETWKRFDSSAFSICQSSLQALGLIIVSYL